MNVDKKEIKKWVKALRSGKFKQGQAALESNDGYCCLGVACKVLIQPSLLTKHADGRLMGGYPSGQKHSPNWLNSINEDFAKKTGLPLSILNDVNKMSFNEIADLVELVYIHGALNET